MGKRSEKQKKGRNSEKEIQKDESSEKVVNTEKNETKNEGISK
jgi:hypothetical protein